MGDVIDLSEYHKCFAWIGHDPKTGEYFVVYENETAQEMSVDGPYNTREEAEASMDKWAEENGAIRQDTDETMQ